MTAHLALTMIVKNEAATLDYCLASVQNLVNESIAVDIGSNGETNWVGS